MRRPAFAAEFVTGQARAVLEHLATYRYLTHPQLLRLGVGTKDHLWQVIRALHGQRLIGRQRFGPNPNAGRLPDIAWLTPPGAEKIGLDKSAAREHRGQAHVAHVMAQVDMHIALRLWADRAGWRVEWVKVDFVGGANARKQTAANLPGGEPYVPDLLALISRPEGARRLLVFEVYLGGSWRHDLSHFRAQLPKIRAAADAEVIEQQHQIDTRARYLVTFKGPDMLRQALAAIPDPHADTFGGFFFADQDAIASNFAENWQNALARPVALFPTQ